MRRCVACGASNPEGARWCGQCFGSLAEPDETDVTTAVQAETQPFGVAPEPRPPTEAVSAKGFRKGEDGEVEWACAGCGSYNPIGLDVCTVCGTAFTARWASEEPAAPPAEAWTNALAISGVLPGGGHLALHRPGGIVRMVLFGTWLALGIVIIASGGPPLLTAGPLLAGAAAVWAITIGDLLRLRAGDPELLRGRTIVWLVTAVIGLEIVGLLSAAFVLT